MPTHHVRGLLGLHTNPNQKAAVPPGACSEASNVVCRRPGVLEPRPGAADRMAGLSPSTAYNVRAMFHYDSDMFAFCEEDASPDDWIVVRLSDATTIISGGLNNPTNMQYRAAKAKDNLYFTDRTRPRLLESGTATSAEVSGASWVNWTYPANLLKTTTPTWLDNNKQVVYRFVHVRVRASGQRVFGPPSGRYRVVNDSGGSRSVEITLSVNATYNDNDTDFIQVYRSKAEATTVEPSDDLQLVGEFQLAGGSVTVSDLVDEADLGAVIYTASTQEGIQSAGEAPPVASDIAWFKNHMFYADVTARQKQLLTLTRGDDATADAGKFGVTLATAVAFTVSTATFSIGSSDGWEAGQMLSDASHATGPENAGTAIASSTSVVSITGSGPYTVTMSNNALASTTLNCYAHDWISIGGTRFYGGISGTHVQASSGLFLVEPDARETVQRLAGATNTRITDAHVDVASGASESGVLYYVTEDAKTTAVTFNSTKGDAWAPEMTQTGTEVQSTGGACPNRLMWSKLDQPEAVPALNYLDIGDSRARIERIVPTTDALYIFKADGVWRLTGEGAATGWRLDEFAPDLVLKSRNAVATMDDSVFAWCRRGVVKIGPEGVVHISGPVDRDPALATDLIAAAQESVSTTNDPMVAWPENHEIWLGVSSVGRYYVWNDQTKTWTTATGLEDTCAAFDEDNRRPLFGGEAFVVRELRQDGDPVYAADLSYTCTVASITSNAVVINSGSGWTPSAGDVLSQSSTAYIVTAVTSATLFTVDRTTSLTSGAATGAEAFTCDVELADQVIGAPGVLKHFGEGSWAFDNAKELVRVTLTYSTDVTQAEGTEAIELTANTTVMPRNVRYYVSRNHQLGTVIRPKITITNGGARWLLTAASLTFEPQSEATVV